MVKWCSAKKTNEHLPLKAFCNKLMTGLTKNDMDIKKIILLHTNGEKLASLSTSQLHDSISRKQAQFVWKMN